MILNGANLQIGIMSLLQCLRKGTSNIRGKEIAARLRRSIHQPSISLFNPTSEHQALRDMIRSFVDAEVEPQAIEFNKHEKFNIDLFRKLGDLGLLGITVDSAYGGSEMDATAAVIAHGKLVGR